MRNLTQRLVIIIIGLSVLTSCKKNKDEEKEQFGLGMIEAKFDGTLVRGKFVGATEEDYNLFNKDIQYLYLTRTSKKINLVNATDNPGWSVHGLLDLENMQFPKTFTHNSDCENGGCMWFEYLFTTIGYTAYQNDDCQYSVTIHKFENNIIEGTFYGDVFDELENTYHKVTEGQFKIQVLIKE